MIDLRTEQEKAREKRHRAIINDYLAISQEQPSFAPTRIMGKVAEMHGLTTMGVRGILVRNHILSNNN